MMNLLRYESKHFRYQMICACLYDQEELLFLSLSSVLLQDHTSKLGTIFGTPGTTLKLNTPNFTSQILAVLGS